MRFAMAQAPGDAVSLCLDLKLPSARLREDSED